MVAELVHSSAKQHAVRAGMEARLIKVPGSGLYNLEARLPITTLQQTSSLLNTTSPSYLQAVIDQAEARRDEARAKLKELQKEARYLRREIATQEQVIMARTADLKAVQP